MSSGQKLAAVLLRLFIILIVLVFAIVKLAVVVVVLWAIIELVRHFTA